MFRTLAILSLSFLTACAGSVTERSHKVTVITEPPDVGRAIAHGNAVQLFGSGGVTALE